MSLPVLVKALLTCSLLVVFTMTLLNMRKANAEYMTFTLPLLSSFVNSAEAACNANSRPVSLQWHRPSANAVNNLTAIINGTDVFGFQFEALTSSSVPYSTYNWCNMPHVRQQEYVVPPAGYKLEYVEVVSCSFKL